jgi:hypothetical protein
MDRLGVANGGVSKGRSQLVSGFVTYVASKSVSISTGRFRVSAIAS